MDEETNSERTPLPTYARGNYEQMLGRLRAFTPLGTLIVVLDPTGHDPGDEDRAR